MASLRERMLDASKKYEEAAKEVSDAETEAESKVPADSGNRDYEVDRLLDNHAYKRLVAIRNSQREKVKLYADQLMALRLDQIYQLMQQGAQIPVQRTLEPH